MNENNTDIVSERIDFDRAARILTHAVRNGLIIKMDNMYKHVCVADEFIGIYGYGHYYTIYHDTNMRALFTRDGLMCSSIVMEGEKDDYQITFHKEVETLTPAINRG